jgi:glycosyltransferase involved in cell wall biosynthesis
VIQILVNGRFLGQRITGAQRYARELLQSIDRCLLEPPYQNRFSVTILVPANTPPPSMVASDLRAIGRVHGHLWEQTSLALHAKAGVLLNLCNTAPLLGRNMVVTILDASVYAVPDAYSFGFRTWYRLMFPIIGKRSHRVITISEFSRGELQSYAGIAPEHSMVVPGSGEHILRIPPDESVLHRLALGSRPYILAVSSRSRHKNLSGIEAAVRLLTGEQFDIVLAGGGNSRVFSSSSSASGEQVRNAGYVTDSELRALYQHASCLVYPSLYEGFGLPPLEAMACGCPVIASRVASLPEVCGDAALYCDPQDPADIAGKIRSLLHDDGLRLDLRRRGLERSAGFRWSRSAESVLTLLQAVAPQ